MPLWCLRIGAAMLAAAVFAAWQMSWSLGVAQGSPEHEEAVLTVLKACIARNIPAAITVTEADVVKRLKQGFRIASLPSGGLEAPMDATLKLARTVIGR